MRRIRIFWLALLIGLTTLAFLAGGCSKKITTAEEIGGKPPMEAKKESPPPANPMEKPKELVTPKPAIPQQPKAEAAPKPIMEASSKTEPKPVPLDLNALRVQFAFDDYTLSTHAKENLEKIAAWMKENPKAKIQIQGNTCNIGTEEYNLALGDRRAYSAKEFMVALGIDPSRLPTVSYGQEKPRVSNTDESNRSLNRRDDFVTVP